MGKPTGFMEIARQTSTELPPEERIQNFNEFHIPLPQDRTVEAIVDPPVGKFCQPIEHRVQHILIAVFQLFME